MFDLYVFNKYRFHPMLHTLLKHSQVEHRAEYYVPGKNKSSTWSQNIHAPCILIVAYYLIIKYANMILEEFVVG